MSTLRVFTDRKCAQPVWSFTLTSYVSFLIVSVQTLRDRKCCIRCHTCLFACVVASATIRTGRCRKMLYVFCIQEIRMGVLKALEYATRKVICWSVFDGNNIRNDSFFGVIAHSFWYACRSAPYVSSLIVSVHTLCDVSPLHLYIFSDRKCSHSAWS